MFGAVKVAELREIAEFFGVDHEESKTKADLVAQLAEEGVDEALALRFYEAKGEDAPYAKVERPGIDAPGIQPVALAEPKYTNSDSVLVRMTRHNRTLGVFGHTFTFDHPFVAMSEDEAQELFDWDPRGFRIATPNEVKEYYG